jgi:hypothetical protein
MGMGQDTRISMRAYRSMRGNWGERLSIRGRSAAKACAASACQPITGSASLTENLVRAGVNFKFNGW